MKRFSALLLFLTFILVLSGCGSSSPSSSGSTDSKANAEKKVVLKLGHGTATTSLYHEGSVKFKELVEEKTNGSVKVDIFSDGSIGHDNDLINFMKTANVQMGMIGVEPLMAISPKLKVVGLPYIFNDRATAYKVLDGEIGQEMVEELPANHGVRVLAYFENGFRNVSNSKKEVNSPKDLQGLKLRTPQSPVSLAIFKSLGANPTPMSFGELYTALEQKTVDGQENPLSLIYQNKFYEVQKYISITNHMYSPMVLTISEKTWTSLSKDQQEAVQEAANEARDYERNLSKEQETELLSKLEEAGVKITKPDLGPFIKATENVHEEFDVEYGADFYQKLLDKTKK